MSLHEPANMFELIDWIFRKLGGDNIFQPPVGGVIEVDVTTIQAIDRILEALRKFTQEHFSGYKEVMIKLEAKKGVSEYELPPDVLNIQYYMEIDDHTSLFALDYQIKQSIGMRLSQFDIVTIELMYEYLAQLNIQIGKKISYAFNALDHTLILNTPPDRDSIIGLVGNVAINPDVTPTLWNDIWFKDYSFELMKLQWGYNLRNKFSNVTLPGGIQLAGKEIIDEAVAQIEKLEEELSSKWQKPPKFFFG